MGVMLLKNTITGLLTVSFILLFCLVESRNLFYLKRDGTDVGCRPVRGMPSEVNLNQYLNEMVRCLASVARPRFGKRSGNILGNTIGEEETVEKLLPSGNDISDIQRRLITF